MKKIKTKNSGFSLIEVMATVFIMSMIVAISITNYSGGSDELNIRMEAHKMSTAFREAQSRALGAVEYGSDIPDGGWGIHLDISEPTKYRIFANTNYNNGSNLEYDANEGNKANGAEIINLKGGVTITNISVGNVADITFVPPDPAVYIYNGTATSTEIEVTLSYKGISKKIAVNYFGLIDITD